MVPTIGFSFRHFSVIFSAVNFYHVAHGGGYVTGPSEGVGQVGGEAQSFAFPPVFASFYFTWQVDQGNEAKF